MPRSIRIVAMIAVLLVASVAPVAAATTATSPARELQLDDNTGNGTVNVSIGSQLATVIAVTSDDVQTTVGETMFEIEFTVRNDAVKAEIAAKRAEAIAARASAIRADYEAATLEFRAGEITREEYARELAVLNGRAQNVVSSYERLQNRTDTLSAFELRASGYDEVALQAAVENLSSVRGSGVNAVLAHFMGNRSGKIEIRANHGVEIEAKSEDGEQSSEFERDRDDDDSITVSQSEALETARSVLSLPTAGNWTLERSSVHTLEGYYKFRFVLQDASGIDGEAEVRVDGSSGDVFRAEEEIEREDDDDRRREDGADEDDERDDRGDDGDRERDRGDQDRDDERADDHGRDRGELALVVERGTPAPGGTVVVTVLADGEPAADVEVFVNDASVGTTNANGHIEVTLPRAGEVDVEARHGDRDGSIEFEFDGGKHRDDVLLTDLNVDASLEDGTVTLEITYRGTSISNAAVFVDGARVGSTDEHGQVTFALGGRTELDVEITKGDVGVELKYSVVNDALEPVDDAQLFDVDEEDGVDDELETENDETEDNADDETEDDTDDETEDTADHETEDDTDHEDTQETDDHETTEDNEEHSTEDNESTQSRAVTETSDANDEHDD